MSSRCLSRFVVVEFLESSALSKRQERHQNLWVSDPSRDGNAGKNVSARCVTTVLVCCLYGACTVLVRCLYGTCMVLVRCLYGACTMVVRCLYGACMVVVQWLYGGCTCGVTCSTGSIVQRQARVTFGMSSCDDYLFSMF